MKDICNIDDILRKDPYVLNDYCRQDFIGLRERQDFADKAAATFLTLAVRYFAYHIVTAYFR